MLRQSRLIFRRSLIRGEGDVGSGIKSLGARVSN